MDIQTSRNPCPRQIEDRLLTLDGYRGLAILLVLLSHLTVRWTSPADPLNHVPAASALSSLPLLRDLGWAGVSLFFMISGFVIVMTLERSQGLFDFAARRIARLWPPIVVAGTITTLSMYAFGPADWKPNALEFVLSIFFIPPASLNSVLNAELTWIDDSYWTLFAEVRFYALSGLIWLVSRKNISLILVLYTLVGFLFAKYADGIHYLTINAIFFPNAMPLFAIGACGIDIYKNRNLIVSAFGILMCGCIFLSLHSGIEKLLLALATILLFMTFVTRKDRINSAFRSKIFLFLGNISYSLYLIHQMIGVSIIAILSRNGMPIVPAIVLTGSAMIVLGWALHHLVELPGRTRLAKLLVPVAHKMARRFPRFSYRLADSHDAGKAT